MCHTICLLPVKTIPSSCHNTLCNNRKGKKRPKQYKRKGSDSLWQILGDWVISCRSSSVFQQESKCIWQENAEWFTLFTIQCFGYLIIPWNTWKWNIAFIYNIPKRVFCRLKLHGSFCIPACYSVVYTLIGSLCTWCWQ